MIACRPGEFVARLGASRYLMLLKRRHSAQHAPRLAAMIIDTVKEPLTVDQVEIELQVRAGLCSSPEQGSAADEMIRRAEIALHDAEESRDRIGVFRVGSDEEHRRRLEMMTDLRRAIENNELHLAFQPKVAIATRRVTSVEALVRWNHPRLGADLAQRVRAACGADGRIAPADGLGAAHRDPPDGRMAEETTSSSTWP